MSLVERFNKIEEDYLSEEVDNVQVWPLVREYVFFELKRKINGTSKPHMADGSLPLHLKIWYLVLILINTVKYLLKQKKESRYFVLSHPRKKMKGGAFIDIYTDPLLDEMEDFIVFERLFQLKHMQPSYRKEIIYAELFDFWPRVISFFYSSILSNESKEIWKGLEDRIEAEFGIRIDVLNRVEKELKRYKIVAKGLRRLLLKVKPKLIIEVVGYYRLCKHINIVASELGIPTFELQHGFISKNHIAYNYPKINFKINSFPSHLGIWSDFFKSQIALPISDDCIETSGFRYFENQRNREVEDISEKKILFISQGNIGEKLSKVALELSRINDYEIVFKLHPSEVKLAKETYKNLYNSERIIVDGNIESDLYKHILESKVVIGVNSTALLEAAGLGKEVIVLKFKGWENFATLIEAPDLPISVSDTVAESLDNKIKNIVSCSNKEKKNNVLINDLNFSFLNIVDQFSSNNLDD